MHERMAKTVKVIIRKSVGIIVFTQLPLMLFSISTQLFSSFWLAEKEDSYIFSAKIFLLTKYLVFKSIIHEFLFLSNKEMLGVHTSPVQCDWFMRMKASYMLDRRWLVYLPHLSNTLEIYRSFLSLLLLKTTYSEKHHWFYNNTKSIHESINTNMKSGYI